MNPKIVVVGGLAAGPSAASKAKRVNPDAEVILFEQGEHISYGICEIPYYVGGIIPDLESLNPIDSSSLERTRGVKVHVLHSVEEIVSTKRKVLVRELGRDRITEVTYDKLILATGSVSRSLGINHSDARNVFRIKSLVDGISIRKFIEEKKPKTCVIVGGGYVGIELCESLVKAGLNVTLLHLENYPMTGLEDETKKAVLDELTRNGITFKANQHVLRLTTDRGGNVISVVSQDGSFATDFVILSIGVEPNSFLALRAGVRLGKNKGVLTDERQETSIDSIFAAGDCCEVKNVINGKWMYLPLATCASRQGRVAGENAGGGRAIFKGAIRSIAVKVFDLEVAQVGLSSVEAQLSGFDVVMEQIVANSKVAFYPGNERITVIGIADRRSKRLVGANVFGGQGTVLRANLLGFAIQQKLTIAELAQLDLIYSPPFSPLWDPMLILANEIKKKLGPSLI